MKKVVAILGALLVVSLFSFSSQAEEQEIKSTGGASLGKWKYDEIDPANALLEVELAGRRLISVSAGYIGNDSYLEYWQFDNSFLSYDKLSSDTYFSESGFNERDSQESVCSDDAEQDCDVLESNRVSKNLIIVTFQRRQSGEVCAGLFYVDEEGYSEGYSDLYGDYFAVSVSCVPAGSDTGKALALSAHYLSLVKKDGRPIARLSRYDLPKPSEQALAPRPSPAPRPIVKHELEPVASDARVCAMSTGYGDWQKYQAFELWVEEAHRRNLSHL